MGCHWLDCCNYSRHDCCVWLVYSYEHGDDYSQAVSSLYLMFKSCLWGVCLAWVVYACSTGNGGESSLLGLARLLQFMKFLSVHATWWCVYLFVWWSANLVGSPTCLSVCLCIRVSPHACLCWFTSLCQSVCWNVSLFS